jgi:hypothetical protein
MFKKNAKFIYHIVNRVPNEFSILTLMDIISTQEKLVIKTSCKCLEACFSLVRGRIYNQIDIISFLINKLVMDGDMVITDDVFYSKFAIVEYNREVFGE